MTALLLVLAIVVILLPLAMEWRRRPMDAAARQGSEGQFADLQQGITHYDWLGPVRGPVAVCVHGLTTPSFVWRGLARGLARLGYRVLIYDLYGRGLSDRPKGKQDAAFFTGQLDALLRHEAVEGDITLLGYSMGGAVAAAYAAAHPERVRHLVLLAPAGLGVRAGGLVRFMARTPLIGDWLMLALFPFQHRRTTEAERSLPSSVPDIVDSQQKELRYRGYVQAVLASVRGILGTAQESEHRAIHRAGIPVLAIWGRDDTIIPLTAMGQLTLWSRGARQEVIENAGHGLPYTHTKEVLAALRDVLREGLR